MSSSSSVPLNFVGFKSRVHLNVDCDTTEKAQTRQGKAYSLQRRKVTVNSPECNRTKLPLGS